MSRARTVVVAACALLFGIAGAAPSADSEFLDAIWVGDSAGLTKVDGGSGLPLFRISNISDVRAVAVDDRASRVWAFSQGALYLYDFNGVLKKSFAAPMLPSAVPDSPLIRSLYGASSAAFRNTVCGHHRLSPGILPPDLLWSSALLATSPEDGSAWLALGSHLYQFSPEGHLLSDIDVGEFITSLTVDVPRSRAWVSSCDEVFAYEADGSLAIRRLLVTSVNVTRWIDYDASRDELWVITGSEIRRIDAQGSQIFYRDLREGLQVVATDGVGNAWLGMEIVADTKVRRVNAVGDTLIEAVPFGGVIGDNTAVALSPHRGDQSVWNATGNHLVRVNAAGQTTPLVTVQALGGPTPSQILSLGAYTDLIAPELTITAPGPDEQLNDSRPLLEFTYTDIGQGADNASLSLLLDNLPLAATCVSVGDTASCTPIGPIADGAHALSATIEDFAGNVSEPVDVNFVVDTVSPVITVTAPSEGLYTNQTSIMVAGSLSEPATLTINNAGASVAPNLSFNHGPVALVEGANTITLRATDGAGNSSQVSRSVTRDTIAPNPPNAGGIGFTYGGDGQWNVSGGAGSVEGGSEVTITNARTGQSVTVIANADGSFSATVPGEPGDEFIVTARDRANNQSAETRITTVPADPSTVATSIDQTDITPFHEATAFLYSGANPTQTGVAAGTIVPERAAVIRGRILKRDNSALPGVTIRIKDHPEFGQTASRADGQFDMVVNGGGPLVVNYTRDGYLPAQRMVNPPWHDFALATDVVMVPLDSRVTVVDLANGGMKEASGNPVTDADGTRQATVMFEQGTTAEMVMPDGSRQPLTDINVRATEYTVGTNGPQAMPADLPATSGYTYAVELSVDQALQAGASSVEFNKPVWVHLENFLALPVGIPVPAGYYDSVRSEWAASANGLVMKLLSVQNGLADIDVDGSNTAADANERAALGITDAERQKIADRFAVGQTFWRVGVTHFTIWDLNLPWGWPVGVKAPEMAAVKTDQRVSNPNCENGSIIECENQVLGEDLPIAGTPFTIHYRSDRVLGRRIANTLNIPLSGSTISPVLRKIDLEVHVAGRKFVYSFDPATNLSYEFTFDGLDVYGRRLRGGTTTALVRIGYRYPTVYYRSPTAAQNSFAQTGSGTIVRNVGRQEATIWQEWKAPLDLWDASILGLGLWSISPQHVFDSGSRILHRGDGSRVAAGYLPLSITSLVSGAEGFSGDGGPAKSARLDHPQGVAVAADGSVYIADSDNHRIRRIAPSGIITTVVGDGTAGSNGDGGPATQARVSLPSKISFGPDGSFFIVDASRRVRRVGPDGIINTVAGSGSSTYGGDGGLATQAGMIPKDVAVGADGSLYVADSSGNGRVRRVTPDGIINNFAGNGVFGFAGDGGLAVNARLSGPFGLAVGLDGSVYISDAGHNRIRRVTPDGVIRTVAGNGTQSFGGDGGPAVSAGVFSPQGIDVGPDGTLYIADYGNNRIRAVGTDGIIRTVAGKGPSGSNGVFSGDNGPATNANIANPMDVALAPDGTLCIADWHNNNRIRRVYPAVPGFTAGDIFVGAGDGTEMYQFDGGGRHLRTYDTRTGAELYHFDYDGGGRLIKITDVDGDETTVERDGSGNPTAIVSPDGQRTSLGLNANKQLETVISPVNETWQMIYTADGLLKDFTNPRSSLSHFDYDSMGRLEKDTNAAGGFINLSLDRQQTSWTVTTSTAEGRQTTHEVENQATGGLRRVLTAPDGAQTVSVRQSSNSTTTTAADGTIVVQQLGPDPRFGMLTPIASSTAVATPGGRLATTTATRAATLTNSSDPLSVTTLTETSALNGKTTTSTYTASTKTWLTTSPLNRRLTTVINTQARPVSSTVQGLLAVTYGYDTRGRLKTISQGSGAAQRLTTLNYGADGYLESIIDAENQTVTFENDEVGRVTKQTLPGNREILYSYDENGNLISLTPPGRDAHVFEYTAVDQQEEYTPPELSEGATVTTYSYNLDKQLELITRPDGQTIDPAYDTAGRLSTLSIPAAGSPNGVYSYTYLPVTGQLDTIAAPGGIGLDYGYDGFLTLSEVMSGEVAGTVSFGYNNDLRVSSETAGGSTIGFGYDNDGLLITAGPLSLGRHAQHGLITGSTLNSIATTRGYSGFGELASETALYLGSTLFQETINERDNLGRIKDKTETIDGVATNYRYQYDQGRLVGVTVNGALGNTYSYDANGNRSFKNNNAYNYDAQDRLLSRPSAGYTYTPNGELLTKTSSGATTTFGYDVLGNLRTVSLPGDVAIAYVIDGRNRRVGKKVNGTLVQGFLYGNQLEPIAELDANNQVVSRFVYASKAHVPDYMIKGGVTYRIVSDHLGSPRLIINSNDGSIAQRMDYDEFGIVTNDTNPGFQPFGFAGGIYDQHTKLTRFGARDYDAETGRWTAKDPINFEGDDTNLYGYTSNDPVNLIDTNGLEAYSGYVGGGIGPSSPGRGNEGVQASPFPSRGTRPHPGIAIGSGILAGTSLYACSRIAATGNALDFAQAFIEVVQAASGDVTPSARDVAGKLGEARQGQYEQVREYPQNPRKNPLPYLPKKRM